MFSSANRLYTFLRNLSFACGVAVFVFSCKPSNTVTINNYIDYNVVFRAPADSNQREEELKRLEGVLGEYLQQFINDSIDAAFKARLLPFKRNICICDNSLVNLTADLEIDSSGGPATKVPRPPSPSTDASGGIVDVIDDNDSLNHPLEETGFQILNDREEILQQPGGTDERKDTSRYKPGGPRDTSLILAIIDTGIDTTKFSPNLLNILFNPHGTSFRNFLIGADPNDFRDDNSVRHGSAVAAIALREAAGYNPRVMVLKALDQNGKGSVFTLSCAMSFAIQNRVGLINASLGYYGELDSVLQHYVSLTAKNNISFIVAAGNVKIDEPSRICDQQANPGNELTDTRTFFPASFFLGDYNDRGNVVSVAGFSSLNWHCHYQNFSKKYVTLGVLNAQEDCCRYKLKFLSHPLSGTSFATPVVSGRLANFIITNGRRTTGEYIQAVTQSAASLSDFSSGGKYLRPQ
jgi:hypothetical protein